MPKQQGDSQMMEERKGIDAMYTVVSLLYFFRITVVCMIITCYDMYVIFFQHVSWKSYKNSKMGSNKETQRPFSFAASPKVHFSQIPTSC